MKLKKFNEYLQWIFLSWATIPLSSCSSALLDPKGKVGIEEYSLVLTAFSLMLIIVIPTILMTIYFSWKYRENNKNSQYNPNWSHSNKIEAIVWTSPILIIFILAILTWKTTHLLEPSNSLVKNRQPITIEVISMDWKWLFIYPKQGIATINEICFPINTELKFRLTSNSVMNSFFIPRLGSQIYVMPGMQSSLHLIANEPGIYNGISASYSGSGFSGMKFKAIATQNYATFDQWIQKTKQSTHTISNMTEFEQIAIPSKYNKVKYFSKVKQNLFRDTIKKFLYENNNKKENQAFKLLPSDDIIRYNNMSKTTFLCSKKETKNVWKINTECNTIP